MTCRHFKTADVDAEDHFVLPCQTDWRGTTEYKGQSVVSISRTGADYRDAERSEVFDSP
jgi:hypothetical protein